MEITVPFLMGSLERSIINGKRECEVFDAAVVASGYVSELPGRRTVSLISCQLYAVAAHFIPIPSRHSR